MYGLSNNAISLAQRNAGPVKANNILEIGNGTSPLADAVSVAVTASAAIPTTITVVEMPTVLPLSSAPSTTRASAALTSSTSAAAAAAGFPTSNARRVVAGLVGAGLLIAL